MDQDNKNKEKEEKEPEVIDDQEEIKRILDELGESDPQLKKLFEDINDKGEIKTVKVISSHQKPRNKILTIITRVILNLVLGLALSGLINWTNAKVLDLVIFLVVYAIIEILLKYIIDTFLPKVFILTFGLINLSYPIISFIISILVFPDVKVKSIFLAILFFIVLNILEVVVRLILGKKKMESTFIKWKKKE